MTSCTGATDLKKKKKKKKKKKSHIYYIYREKSYPARRQP